MKRTATTFLVAVLLLLGSSTRVLHATVVADLAADYQDANLGETSQTINGGAGIPDTAGTGTWDYLEASPGGGAAAVLTYVASPGDSGLPGYGGTIDGNEIGFSMPGISRNKLFGTGVTPPAGALNGHPGNQNKVELVARWTAGQSGLMNIAGSVHNFSGSGTGVAYVLRVNGVDQFAAPISNGAGNGFSLLANVNAGDQVDLVVGPNGAFGADESHLRLRATQPYGRLVANVGADYVAGAAGQTSQQVGIGDTDGAGAWNYYASDNINIDATANKQLLIFGGVGNAGNNGYGGGSSYNLPAVTDQQLFTDGEPTLPDELALHPANVGQAREYTVLRWTAGSGEGGLINIVGNIRNIVPPSAGMDSIDFHVLVDGTTVYSVVAGGPTLPLSFFDVHASIQVGSTVDFVLGNNTTAYNADESVLSAFITQYPEPGTLSLLALGGLGLWRRRRKR